MLGLNRKLKRLSEEGESIKVAVAGVGQMGKGLISHIRDLEGMDVLVVANREITRTLRILIEEVELKKDEIVLVRAINKANEFPAGNGTSKIPDMEALGKELGIEVLVIDEAEKASSLNGKLKDYILRRKIILTDSLLLLSRIEDVDVVVDATGSPEAGAYIAFSAIFNRKHVVSLNVETDVIVGPILKKLADNQGIVYTVSAGDEPGALIELCDFADALGLEVVVAGKGKNNPLDRDANPTTLKEYAESKGSSAKMMTSFVDGTKSMIEMACLSNATGLIPDCRGMHGPRANVRDLVNVFRLKKDGGILNRTGVVDFAIGDIAPGVFLVYTTEQKFIKKDLKYLQLGEGPNYLLYRPYHLTSIETPLSIARAYFYGEPTIAPLKGLVSEVITVAKKDLREGEIIDGIGGYTVYGLIELYEIARKENLLPIGLSEGCRLKRNIEKGRPITYDDVVLRENSMVLQLRRLQERTIFV
ncbi:MAG: NAD(P)-dependent oxidoreductase [Actinobacteria bacterium]|nr:NAD(P)-dependent oxidoreductase [Actinomycetota bacterium]